MKKHLLVLLLTLFGLNAFSQGQTIINNHMTKMSEIITKHKATFDAYQVKEINAIKWNASDFDESFLYFFSRFQPHTDEDNTPFKLELNEWTMAVKKDLKSLTETDIQTYITKIKKMQNANLTMWYFVNVYANMFYSQKSMQDKKPMDND